MTPAYEDEWLTLYGGDCREVLASLTADSVDCVVTSPPYWGLRDYGTAQWEGGDPQCDHQPPQKQGATGQRADRTFTAVVPFRDQCGKCSATRIDRQIGLEESPEEYVANMVAVFREVRRVLKPSGTCWLNLGDSYAGSGKGPEGNLNKGETFRHLEHKSGGVVPSGLKPKDLVGIPWLVAKALQEPYYTGKIRREADRAWLAGWLDGEGTISFVERDRGEGHTPTYDVRVFITNRDREPLDYFAGISGGNVYQHEDGTRENRYGSRPCYRWQMGTHDGALLLRELYPYLRTKRRQAALVWTLYTTLRHKNGHARTPDAVVARRREIADMVRALNRGEDVTLPPWVEEPPSPTEPGWYLRSDIIWAKKNGMPESVTDRPTRAHEYIFLLTKNARYYYDADAVRQEPAQSTVQRLSQNDGHPNWNGQRDRGFPGSDQTIDINKMLSPGGANLRDVWWMATMPYPDAHFAVFPPELPEKCIQAGSSERGVCPECGAPWERVVERTPMEVRPGPGREGMQSASTTGTSRTSVTGTMLKAPTSSTIGWERSCEHDAEPVASVVLDPFGGSGTTGMVANRLSRRAILIDLNPDYITQQMKRNANVPLGLTA